MSSLLFTSSRVFLLPFLSLTAPITNPGVACPRKIERFIAPLKERMKTKSMCNVDDKFESRPLELLNILRSRSNVPRLVLSSPRLKSVVDTNLRNTANSFFAREIHSVSNIHLQMCSFRGMKTKIKPYSSWKARFRATATGKYARKQKGKRHKASSKTLRQKMLLRATKLVHNSLVQPMKKLGFNLRWWVQCSNNWVPGSTCKQEVYCTAQLCGPKRIRWSPWEGS